MLLRYASRLILVVSSVVLLSQRALSPTTQAQIPPAQNLVLRGNKLFYEGRPRQALKSYRQAVKKSTRNVEAYLNGAAVWSVLGDIQKSAEWYRKASELYPQSPRVRTALAEAEFRAGRPAIARTEVERALSSHPSELHALILKGRLDMRAGRHEDAVRTLETAAGAQPDSTLAQFWLGRAREAAGDEAGALDAYGEAVSADSYFTQARYRLTRLFERSGQFHKAWKHVSRLIDSAPHHKGYGRMARRLRPRLRDSLAPRRPEGVSKKKKKKRRLPLLPPPPGKVPVLRVGIGTTPMGRPRLWKGADFTCKTPFKILDAKSKRVLAKGPRGRRWTVRTTRSRFLEVRERSGRRILRRRGAIIIQPDLKRGGWTYIREPARRRRGKPLARTLRGGIELSAYPGRRGLKVINVVDLESYTHGVLTAEMPIDSPMESLKAQAVIARSHALFIKQNRRRHRSDGYHLCDGQHCQMYYGVGAETDRSRRVVTATGGRVVTYRGRVAHVLYSANSGGHTQSAREIKGWGDVPHFTGVPDSPPATPIPASPWQLREWLRSSPQSFSRPSAYVHAAHYRWARVISADELSARVNRSLRIGRLKAIIPLRRASSGHINAVLVRGSRGSRLIDTEMRIRGLFGIGSQRSALFIVDAEYDERGRPENFIFYGGGWGHGVGMCQSGAMGRAERGQSYAEILRAYYRGTEIGNLRYQ